MNPFFSRRLERSVLGIFSTQPSFAGTDDGVRTVCHLQLGEDVGEVIGYSLGADIETCGDLGIAMTPSDKVENLALTGAELGEGLFWGSWFRCREEVHEAFGDLRPEVYSHIVGS